VLAPFRLTFPPQQFIASAMKRWLLPIFILILTCVLAKYLWLTSLAHPWLQSVTRPSTFVSTPISSVYTPDYTRITPGFPFVWVGYADVSPVTNSAPHTPWTVSINAPGPLHYFHYWDNSPIAPLENSLYVEWTFVSRSH
jgi:hypothetical protein